MKQISLSLFCLISFKLISQNLHDYIPAQIPYCLGINFSQLSSKSEGIDYSKYFKSFIKTSRYNYYSEEGKCELLDINKLIQSPATYGLDIKSNCYMYKTKVEDVSGTVYIFKLSNADLFSKSIQTSCFRNVDFQKRNLSDGYAYITNETSVAYNGLSACIFIKDYNYYYDRPERNEEGLTDSTYLAEKSAENARLDSLFYQRLNSQPDLDYEAEANRFLNQADTLILSRAKERELKRQLEYMNGKFDVIHRLLENFLRVQPESISRDRNFSQLLAEKHDLFVYMNAISTFNTELMNPFGNYRRYAELNNLRGNNYKLAEGLSSSYTVDFENGKALVHMKSVYNNHVYPYLKKSYGVKQNKDLLKYIDGSNLLGYLSVAVNAKELAKFYEDFYREIFENMPKSENDRNMMPAIEMFYAFIDKEVLYNTLDGRMILACTGFTDVKLKYKSYDYDDEFNRNETTEERIVKQPRMVLAASVGNQENAKKLFNILSRFTVFTKLKDNVLALYGNQYNPMNLFLALTDDALIMSNDVNVVLNQSKGLPKSQQMPAADKKLICSHNMAFKVFADKMMAGVQDSYLKTTSNMPWFAQVMNGLGNLEMYDSRPGKNTYGLTAVLNLKDQSSNALYQLLKMMQTGYGR